MRSFSQRFVGALRLDPEVYEEVEADHGAIGQAVAVILISNVAVGLGVGLGMGLGGFILLTVVSLITWFLWAALTWFIGTKILPSPETSSDIVELMRTTGFAAAPGVFRVLAVTPLVGGILGLVVHIWMLVAMVVAVRQALDYTSTWRAVAVCLTGWLIYGAAGYILVPAAAMFQ